MSRRVEQFDVVAFDADSIFETDGRDIFVWQLDPSGATQWLNTVSSAGVLRGAEVVPHPDGGVVFGHRIPSATTLEQQGGPPQVVQPPGAAPAPILVSYTAEGALRFVLQPASSPGGNFDEMAITGRTLAVDMPIFEGTYTVGPDTRLSGPTKDAMLVLVDL